MMQLFKFERNNVRVIEKNGEPWFVLKDVCEVLALGNPSQVKVRLGDGVISNEVIRDSLGRPQDTTIINEDGLYDVILDSRKPEAKTFRKWITSEVIPSIRKYGSYSAMIPQNYAESLRMLAEKVEENERIAAVNQQLLLTTEQQEQQLKYQEPRVAFANMVIAAGNTQPMGTVAKAVGMGRNNLFKFLREKGVIMKNSTIPYQQYIDRGFFVVREVPTKRGDDEIVNEPTARVTARGLEFIAKLVRENLPKEA